MAEQLDKIGLQAVMDLREWSKGFNQYMSQLGQISGQTEQTAQKSTTSFKSIAAVFGGVAAAIGAAKIANELKNITVQAAGIGQVAAAFEGVSGGADKMLASLRQGSAGMVADVDLMKSYNSAAQLVGKSFADQLPSAFQYLGKVAAASGQDMGYMLDSLVKGVGRLSPMILDNLGIQVNLTEANEKYAAATGKAADGLTKAEQQTAMMNLVMEKLAKNTAAMPSAMGSAAQQIASFSTTVQNLRMELGTQLVPVLQTITSAMSEALAGEGMKAAMAEVGVAAQGLAGALSEILPQFVTLAAEAIPKLIEGLGLIVNVGTTVIDLFSKFDMGALAITASTLGMVLGVVKIIAAIKEFGGAMAILNAIMAVNPIVLVATAIVAAGLAIARVVEVVKTKNAEMAAAEAQNQLVLMQSASTYEEYTAARLEFLRVQNDLPANYTDEALALNAVRDGLMMTRTEFEQYAATLASQVVPSMESVRASMDADAQAYSEVGASIPPIIALMQDLADGTYMAFDGMKGSMAEYEGEFTDMVQAVREGVEKTKNLAWEEAFFSPKITDAMDDFERITEDHYQKLADIGQDFTQDEINRQFDYNLERARAEQEYIAERESLVAQGADKEIAQLDAKYAAAQAGAEADYSIQSQLQQRALLQKQAAQQAAYVAELTEQRDQNIRLMVAELQANEKFQQLDELAQQQMIATLYAGGSVALQNEYKRAQDRLALEHAVTKGIADEAQTQVDLWVAAQAATVEAAQAGLAAANARIAAFKIDLPVPQIRAQVMAQATSIGGTAGKAVGTAASKAAQTAVSSIKTVADEVAALNKAVIDAASAIAKLEVFEVTAGVTSGLERFKGFVKDTITTIQGAIKELDLDAEDIKGATDFSGAVSAVVGLIRPALEAIEALVAWENRESVQEQLNLLVLRLKEIIPTLTTAANDFDSEGVTKASELYKAIEGIVGFIAKGIEGIVALQEWERTESVADKMAALIARLTEIVPVLVEASRDYKLTALVAASSIYESMEAVVGFIEPAIEALVALTEWTAKNADYTALTETLTIQIKQVASAMEQAALELEPASEDALAFWKSVEEITGFIEKAIDTLKSLEDITIGASIDYQHVAYWVGQTIGFIAEDMDYLFLRMTKQWDVDIAPGAAGFWKSISEVTEFLGDAVDVLQGLSEIRVGPAIKYQHTAYAVGQAIGFIAEDMDYLHLQMTETWNVDISKEAAIFWGQVDALTSTLGNAMDVLKGLAEFPMIFNRPFRDLANGIGIRLMGVAQQMVIDFEMFGFEVNPAAEGFYNDLTTLTGHLKDAMDVLKGLAEFPMIFNRDFRGLASGIGIRLMGVAEQLQIDFNAFGFEVNPAATQFYNDIGALVAIITPAIEALTAIGDYTSKVDIVKRMERFETDLNLLLPIFQRLTNDWSGKITEQSALLSGYIQGAMEMLTASLAALTAVGGYQTATALDVKLGVIESQLGQVFTSISTKILPMFATGIDDLKLFAEKMGIVKDAMALAIETLNTVNTVVGISVDKATAQMTFNVGLIEKELTKTAAILTRILPLAAQFDEDMRAIWVYLDHGLTAITTLATRTTPASPFAAIEKALKTFFLMPSQSLIDAAFSLGWTLGTQIKLGVEGALGVASPSTVMEKIGVQMRAGLQQGFEQARVPYQGAATTNNYRQQSVSLSINANVASDVDVEGLGRRVLQIVADGMRL